ncbi:Putative uncharacterized protein [Taphrina deformans PYCC 5710]|uniref:Thioesterase family protein n=1 Tax=Taphrina deformans (strain PYCC 5710 / ATCC 11124 / CBS 356.35 / IMI 108563 / JCM 9778 / NBRC 8474) TaxID=1097556 RepID=R4XCW4_TAPDE|nr:Putative uncharacterized protein [Taphrina deformans PYCC 5710]|eukprot:CCG83458.1 Putative uncharacterized protein [Taphrina deformans PYCC 5710]
MYDFDAAIAVRATPSPKGHYQAELLRPWCIGAVPHGGYLLSVLLNAAKEHSKLLHKDLKQTDPIQMSVAFIVKAQVGSARVVVEELKIGRGYSNYRLSLQQQDEGGHWITCIHALIIMGSFAREVGPVIPTTSYYVPRLEDCPEMEAVYSDFRAVAKNFKYWEPKDVKSPAVENHWLEFKDGRPMDLLAMALITDLMTPLPLRVCDNERGWYPTLSLDLQFKQAPKPGGLYTYLQAESDSIHNGRFDITTRCFDADHKLIALARHSALMVSASRNLSKRSSRPKI